MPFHLPFHLPSYLVAEAERQRDAWWQLVPNTAPAAFLTHADAIEVAVEVEPALKVVGVEAAGDAGVVKVAAARRAERAVARDVAHLDSGDKKIILLRIDYYVEFDCLLRCV